MNDTTDRPMTASRFRFSIKSMLIVVTTIGGLLAYLQFKMRLLDPEAGMSPLRDLATNRPINVHVRLLVTQIIGFVLAAAALYVYHRPRTLWLYLSGQVVWFITLVLVLFVSVSLNTWIGDGILITLFFEPTVSLFVAAVACAPALVSKISPEKWLLISLFVFSLLAEFSAILALDAFAGAIAAVLMR